MEKKTFNRIRGSSLAIEQAAVDLRKKLTPAEDQLWQALRNRKLHGLRFRRQHPVGRFILDFFCSEYKLVIELDGSVHNEQLEYDTDRTKELQGYGYRVLRFDNKKVLDDLNSVLDTIHKVAITPISSHGEEIRDILPSPPQSPSPRIGRGGSRTS